MAKVKAVKRGFDGKRVREIGEVFEFEGKPGSWMELVEEKKPAKPAKLDKVEEAVKPAKPAKK